MTAVAVFRSPSGIRFAPATPGGIVAMTGSEEYLGLAELPGAEGGEDSGAENEVSDLVRVLNARLNEVGERMAKRNALLGQSLELQREHLAFSREADERNRDAARDFARDFAGRSVDDDLAELRDQVRREWPGGQQAGAEPEAAPEPRPAINGPFRR